MTNSESSFCTGSETLSDVLAKAFKPTLSFEYYPPKSDTGVTKVCEKIKAMRDMNPVWVDVTFPAGGERADQTLRICERAFASGVNVLVHVVCANMTVSDIDCILQRMKLAGLRNIMALRGDGLTGCPKWAGNSEGFHHAVDLVRYIKLTYGDYFCIAVAGYPEGHVECESLQLDLLHLKEKVDAGAELIITQMFYDVNVFIRFVDKCSDIGIGIPIIPGIMPITSYKSFQKMISICRTMVPLSILEELELIKENDEETKAYGTKLAVSMCKALLASERADSIHLYTMNFESNIREIVKQLSTHLAPIHSNWCK